MSILISALLVQAIAATPPGPSTAETTPARTARICRDMLTSSSRLRPVRVCKTRAGWQRWAKCHSATRYCAPPTQATVTVASLPNEKLFCKYIKETGSRLGQQKVCATRRQWDLAEQETQELIRKRQSTSTLVSESPSPPGPGGGGPR